MSLLPSALQKFFISFRITANLLTMAWTDLPPSLSLSSSPTILSFIHSASATLVSLLFLKHLKSVPTSGPLCLLLPLPEPCFPNVHMVCSLTSLEPLFKCHFSQWGLSCPPYINIWDTTCQHPASSLLSVVLHKPIILWDPILLNANSMRADTFCFVHSWIPYT